MSREELIKLYRDELKSTGDIAKITGMSRGKVRYELHKAGIECRPRSKVSLDLFKSKEGTDEFDYFLGVLATDGTICHNVISLEFAENNSEILTLWNNFLNNQCNILKHRGKYFKIAFSNKEVCALLSSYGITERKSLSLSLSKMSWGILRGIFDGDGYLTQDKRHKCSFKFKIASGSIKFLQQIQEFLLQSNIGSSIYKEKDTLYTLIVGRGEDIYTIYCNMYKDSSCFLRRKYDKFGPLVEKFTKVSS